MKRLGHLIVVLSDSEGRQTFVTRPSVTNVPKFRDAVAEAISDSLFA
jgi:hypothetical protein